MKLSIQQKLTSPRLSKSRAVDPLRRSLIQESMDAFLNFDEDDLSLEDLHDDIPKVTKPSIQKPGFVTKDDRSTSTEVTTGLEDSATSFDLTEMEQSFNIFPVSPYLEALDLEEHTLASELEDSDRQEEEEEEESEVDSTRSLDIVKKPNMRKAVSIESVDIGLDDFLRMPDLRSTPPMRRTSITVPIAPLTPLTDKPNRRSSVPNRRSSVSFAEVAEVSFIEKLGPNTDYDSLYWTEEEMADFRHEAFLEQCGISEDDFE